MASFGQASPKKVPYVHHHVVRPQQFSDKSVVESVVNLISDVVPQSYGGHQKLVHDDKDKIQWVRFECPEEYDSVQGDGINKKSEAREIPLLLVIGYQNGVQLWNITPNGEAIEMLSLREGPIKILRLLPCPYASGVLTDKYQQQRPLLAVCDASSAGQPYCAVKFTSLKTGDEVHSLSFSGNEVVNIESNNRVVVVVFKEKICVCDAATLAQNFWILNCYPCTGPNKNPVALGTRWLAYADKRLVPLHQSLGGMSGDGAQSYAATVISAAKGAFKGLTMFGEAMVNSVTGNKPQQVKVTETMPGEQNGYRPGIVTILDLQDVQGDTVRVTEDMDGSGLIAHFYAHANEPVAHLQFDPTGTLLLTACVLGHNFHVFRVLPHPCGSSLGAVHHLYTLHRGDTTAKVIDMKFSADSRWVAVSTHRGTSHIFPITPYGGPITRRTHCTHRVVNRSSRFHKSAGLDEMDMVAGRQSPVMSGSPKSSSGHFESYPNRRQMGLHHNIVGNARLPPYPHPTTLQAYAQIKQPFLLSNPMTKGQNSSKGGKQQEKVLSICACFSSPRRWVTPDRRTFDDSRRYLDSIFIMCQTGTLIEYGLHLQTKLESDKSSEDAQLSLIANGYLQWNLQRSTTSTEFKPPFSPDSIIPSGSDHGYFQFSPITHDEGGKDDYDSSSETSMDTEQDIWLSQVEIITHLGPHRRLWMGPQFSFKTYQNVQNTTVLSSHSSSLLSQSPEANLTTADVVSNDVDLESLKIQPTRSSPVAMPYTRPAYRRTSSCGTSSSPLPQGQTNAAFLIEAGSYEQSPHLCDVYSEWTESGMVKPQADEEDDDRIKETLAEAMIESPMLPHGPSNITNEVFIGSHENLSSSSGSSSGIQTLSRCMESVDTVFPNNSSPES